MDVKPPADIRLLPPAIHRRRAAPEFKDLTPAESHEYYAIKDPQGIRQTEWLWRKGMAYIESRRWLTARHAIYKVWIAFSPVYSPAKGFAFQTVYATFYLPLFVVSGLGFWLTRRSWRDTGYILYAGSVVCRLQRDLLGSHQPPDVPGTLSDGAVGMRNRDNSQRPFESQAERDFE
jgi:hypothetical protein